MFEPKNELVSLQSISARQAFPVFAGGLNKFHVPVHTGVNWWWNVCNPLVLPCTDVLPARSMKESSNKNRGACSDTEAQQAQHKVNLVRCVKHDHNPAHAVPLTNLLLHRLSPSHLYVHLCFSPFSVCLLQQNNAVFLRRRRLGVGCGSHNVPRGCTELCRRHHHEWDW